MDLLDDNDVYKLEVDKVHLTNNLVFFPDLVWELVLHKIKKPVDIESCSNATTYFWKYLGTKRLTKVTFPFMIQQMSRFFHEYQSNSTNDEGEEDRGIISMKHFWKLRETSKFWNKAIENLHDSVEAGHFEIQADMESFENEHLRNWATEVFHPQELPQRFLHHFDATHYDSVERKSKKNPFLGRSVDFNEILISRNAPAINHLYVDGLIELVNKYGKEIWYASFVFREVAGINVYQIYQFMVGFMKRMPNLKALRVACNHEDVEGNEQVQAAFAEYRATCLEALIREILENPIPTLQQLEFIWTKDLPTPIFNELLQRNGRISKLKVERQEHHCEYSIFEEDLPNLVALHLNFFSVEDFEELESCGRLLKLDKFYFWYNGCSELLRWSRLFRALDRHMAESCTELLLKMPFPKTENESVQVFYDTRDGRLELSNLKHMAIVCDAAVALDFLLPANKSLRVISMRELNGDEDEFLLKRFAEYENKQVMELIGFKERLGESNVWEAFPQLVKFNLFRKNEMGGCVCYKRRATSKKKHYFDIERWYNRTN